MSLEGAVADEAVVYARVVAGMQGDLLDAVAAPGKKIGHHGNRAAEQVAQYVCAQRAGIDEVVVAIGLSGMRHLCVKVFLLFF